MKRLFLILLTPILAFGLLTGSLVWLADRTVRAAPVRMPQPTFLTGTTALTKTNPVGPLPQDKAAAAGQVYNTINSSLLFFPPYYAEHERMGFAKTSDHDTSVLRAGWYLDWGANANPAHPGGAAYARMIHFGVTKSGLCDAATQHSQISPSITGTALIQNVQANPGALWLVGNEPDSYYNGSPIQAELYAELYHYFYTTIKTADPTAKVAVGGIVQPSPLRMAYLDKVLNHYQVTYGQPFPTDLWNIHAYILNEDPCGSGWGATIPPFSAQSEGWQIAFTAQALLDLTEMEANLRAFRSWMAERGYRDRPLIITEFGVLPPPNYSGFGDAVAEQFLNDMFQLLLTARDETVGYPADDNRLVQMWAWFSTDHQPPAGYQKYGGDLFVTGGTDLTNLGQAFKNQVDTHYRAYSELQVLPDPEPSFSSTEALTINARIHNLGNAVVDEPQVALDLIDAASGLVVAQTTLNLDPIGPRFSAKPAQVTYTWQITAASPLSATIPYSAQIRILTPDVNPDNNTLVYAVRWRPLIDLTVSKIEFDPGPTVLFEQPFLAEAQLSLTNQGRWPSPAISLTVSLRRPGESAAQPLPPLAMPALASEGTITLTVPISVTQPGPYYLTAAFPASLDTSDLNSANNQRTAMLLAATDIDYLPLSVANAPLGSTTPP